MTEIWMLIILTINKPQPFVSPHTYDSEAVCRAVGEMTKRVAEDKYPGQIISLRCERQAQQGKQGGA